VSLTEIFRQSDTSPIVTAAHDIFHGRVPEAPLQSDFRLFPLADEDEVLKLVLNLSEKLYGQRANFQVLSPRHAGTLGVTNLNTRLRAILNPAQHGLHEMTVGGEVLREGDRVIVSKNDYKLGVFNGDVAKINRIDKNAKMVEIKIHGPPVVMVSVPFAKVGTLLRLAYAVTVHRCQGLEYDVVVMPLVGSFAHQLQRNLFYTAITRAKKKVLLVGTYSAMERAVDNNREDARNTLFSHRLRA
jgi:exodeoxyribonuclease V alpha subunit